MSPNSDRKRRPPPIVVPPPPAPQTLPGANSFALGMQATREAQGLRRKPSELPANSTPLTSPIEGHIQGEQTREPGSQRGSNAANTLSQLLDFARGSPRKSDSHTSSTNSRHGCSTRSRHSNRSGRSGGTNQLSDIQGEDEDDMEQSKTSRAQIESKAEKKFFKMMGQPTVADGKRDSDVTTIDRTNEGREDAPDKKEESTKSPKKKIFGVSIPAFLATPNINPTSKADNVPPMPSKAAQVLGASSMKSRESASRTIRPPPRSDTSKSLPSKIYDPSSYPRRTTRRSPPRSNLRTPTRKAHFSGPERIEKTPFVVSKPKWASPALSFPPTPPRKDTPPDVRDNLKLAESKSVREFHVKKASLKSTIEKPTQVPDFFAAAPVVPEQGGESPTKFCPYSAEEYAQLVDRPPIVSACAQVVSSDTNAHSVTEGQQRVERTTRTWRSEDDRATLTRKNSHSPLKPRFYSPSNLSVQMFDDERPSQNTDQRRLLFNIPPLQKKQSDPDMASEPSQGSIHMIFQGDASEIGPEPETVNMTQMSNCEKPSPQKNRAHNSASNPSQKPQDNVSTHPHGHPAGVSPARSGYNNSNDLYANCPSAVPSPLHRMPTGQQVPQPPVGPMTSATASTPLSLQGALSDGSNILTHFYMCNEHMDVVGRSLFDLIVERANAQINVLSLKHNELYKVLEARFEEIKSSVASVNKHHIDNTAAQSGAINLKLDKLLEFIKTDVVEPMAAQSRKTAGMEKDIEGLKRALQELQMSVQMPSSSAVQAQSLHSTQMGPPAGLPTQRSQPSLAGYYEPAGDPTRETPRMPMATEGRGNGQYRYGNVNSNHAYGPNWYRLQNTGNENKDKSYLDSNPYQNNGSGQYGNGTGGFFAGMPGYYAGNAHTFNSGGSK